jgi:hypothetical protein
MDSAPLNDLFSQPPSLCVQGNTASFKDKALESAHRRWGRDAGFNEFYRAG